MNQPNHNYKARQTLESRGNVLSSLITIPKNMSFSTQNENEKISIIARQSFIKNLGWMLNVFFLIFILPFILFTLRGVLASAFGIFSLSISQLTLFTLIFTYVLMISVYSVTNFTRWYFNIYIVTNERIIDYDFFPFSGFKISEARLTNIEDVTQTQKGFLSTFFNYGSVFIQTAAERTQFRFEDVPNPNFVRNVIVELADELKDRNFVE